MRRFLIGDGISYTAELWRVKGNKFVKLYVDGHGYIIEKINDDLMYVWNGVRIALVHRADVTKNHNR